MASFEKILLEGSTEGISPGIDLGRSTKLSFPFLEIHASLGPMDYVDPYIISVFQIGKNIWSKEKLPQHWLDFILEVIDKREEIGRNSSINVFSVICFILDNNKDALAKALHIVDEGFDEFELYNDSEKIVQLMELFLGDEYLRNILKEKLIDFVPFRSGDNVEVYSVRKFIKELNLKDGIVLDVGCGDGMKTHELVGEGYKVIGVDNQYYHEQFSESWDSKGENLQFIVGNGENLSFPDKSVDVIVMTSVIGHYTEKAIRRLLKETKRVLKPNGYILIGPQRFPFWYFEYRVLKKYKNGLAEL